MLFTILNMSLTASIVISAVLLLRYLLKNAPRAFAYALWAVVLFRLLCPFSFHSPISLFHLTDARTEEGTMAYDTVDAIFAEEANSVPMDTSEQGQGTSSAAASREINREAVLTAIWLIGACTLAVCGLFQTVLLRHKLIGAVPIGNRLFLADHVFSPFTFGLFRPRIYLPSDIQSHERSYILLHERIHVRRGDHLTRLLAFAALCLHWFNPLVWLAFFLSERDMELSCDEAVLRKIPKDIRAEYAASLLRIASGKRSMIPPPLFFGKNGTRERVEHIMQYRKPKLVWVIPLAVLLLALAVILITNPFRTVNETLMGADYAVKKSLVGEVADINGFRISADDRLYIERSKKWEYVGEFSEYAIEKADGLLRTYLKRGRITDAAVCSDQNGAYLAAQTSYGQTVIGYLQNGALSWLCTLENQFHKSSYDLDFFQHSLSHAVNPQISVCAIHQNAKHPDALFVAFLADEEAQKQMDMEQMGFALFRVFDGRYYELETVHVFDEREKLIDGVYLCNTPVRMGTRQDERYSVMMVHPKNDELRCVQLLEDGRTFKSRGWGIQLFSCVDADVSEYITYRIYDNEEHLLAEHKIYNGEDFSLERGELNIPELIKELPIHDPIYPYL